MIYLQWLKGIFARRGARLAGAAVGIALTVSLLASVGIFITYNSAEMTTRAIADVPVDWQIQLTPGADANAVQTALEETTQYTSLETVGYADAAAFEANAGGTVQTTGAGKALGVNDSYFKTYPCELRSLQGADSGVLIAQQTAANLHVRVGDKVTIQRMGLPPVAVTVDGIVDLPNADSLFQAVGLPAGAAPQAPPDNVVILPASLWHQFFDDQAAVRPDSVRMQMHAGISHSLSSDPSKAYLDVLGKANNLEARIAGSGIIGNNLAARLSAAREDSLYAKVLFLFLGLPGAVLALLMTLSVTSSGESRRGREQAVLRIQGASATRILSFETVEAVGIGVIGIAAGVLATLLAVKLFIPGGVALGYLPVIWIVASSVFGLLTALASMLIPAWKQVRMPQSAAVKSARRNARPLWNRIYLDIVLLALAGIEFWRTASTGYQVVLAPEGVAAISVSYEAFIAPFCLWLGAVLLSMRLFSLGFGRSGRFLSHIIKPVAGRLSGIAAASMSRDRQYVVRGAVLVSLAVSFAVSTAIFNTTYNAQARVDAELTNGADVTVTGLVPFTANDQRLAAMQSVSGVSGMQLMQHRFAYVGNDLQDIYGIDAAHIKEATNISNAFFAGGDAKATLSALTANKDGVLVSQETVNDYQLQPGDLLNLRMQDARDHQYHIVPFHFIGIVREFPTAPSDSFIVANADYISEMTANGSYEVALLKTSAEPAAVAEKVDAAIGTQGVKVSDLTSTQRVIGSGMTSVDLHGLTALELAYAVLLVGGALGLVLALGLAERRRNFSILQAIGAKKRHLDAFIKSEAALVLALGASIGALLGWGVAGMLVKVLTGVFDPPPEALSIPWGFLALLVGCAFAATAAAVCAIRRISARPAVEELRKL